jgi:cell wall assembly regulator SMI1
MKLVDIVREASKLPLTTEDGDPDPIRLEPPLSAEELAELEKRLPCPLPDDVRELLGFCSGFSGGAADFVDFTDRDGAFALEEAFPHGHPIAGDGYGNFWVVDLMPDSTSWGPVYFACHDPPIILFQSATLEEFLSELFKMSLPPFRSLVDDVHEDRLFQVWRKNPGVLDHAGCAASADPELRGFAEELGPGHLFVDMRNALPGFGFSWGRYGPAARIRRRGRLPLFALEKKKGWLSWLFGA